MTFYLNINLVFVLATLHVQCTSHALTDFVTKVANAIDCQKYLTGVYLDLSKALIPSITQYYYQNWKHVGHHWDSPSMENRLHCIFMIENNLSKLMILNLML